MIAAPGHQASRQLLVRPFGAGLDSIWRSIPVGIQPTKAGTGIGAMNSKAVMEWGAQTVAS